MQKLACLCRVLAITLVISCTGLAQAQVKPGDTITQAEALLTPITRWMLQQGMPMEVIETKKVHWPKAYKEATEHYSSQVKLSADGKEIFNYVAGCPFPEVDLNDPLAGYKIMWNYEQKLYDNSGSEVVDELVNSKGEVDRTFPYLWRRMKWTGRLYLDPKPVVPHNPSIHRTDLYGPHLRPEWNASWAMYLVIRYLSPQAPDNHYLYDPAQRHVLNLSNAKRAQPMHGDAGPDSWGGFNGKLSMWTFHVLAEKDILAVVHSGKYGDPSAWCAPRDGKHGILAALPCVSWEKRRVWVIEATPTGYRRDYPYSKRILYIDQNFFGLVLTEMYDQQGELWKGAVPCFFYTHKPYEGYPTNPISGGKYNYEDEWPFIPNGVIVDIQAVRATASDAPSGYKKPSEWRKEWYFNEGGPLNRPRLHTLSHLRTIH